MNTNQQHGKQAGGPKITLNIAGKVVTVNLIDDRITGTSCRYCLSR
jgi:hypothetical protein